MYNFYDKILHKIGKEKGKDTVYINIGAMDGVMFDESAAYVAKYEYFPLYVEPIPYLFDKLRNNIKDPRARFENAAISDYDGTTQMLTIDKNVIDQKLVHECFYGMSAIYPPKNGLSSDGDRPVVEQYGKIQIVPCITLATLFSKYDIQQFDILSIDTEGHDWKIIKQLDLHKYQPSIIRAEYINLNVQEKEEICKFFSSNGYVFEIVGQNIDAIPVSLFRELFDDKSLSENTNVPSVQTSNQHVTIVTGLWNLGRDNLANTFSRSYDHYKETFVELLKCPNNMFIYISRDDEEFVWKHRSKHNTFVKIMELDQFPKWFAFYDKVQQIRQLPEWYNQAGWLAESPQAKLEHYNPIVMGKMFMLNDAALHNPFGSEYFYWIDAGIANTVHPGYFYHDKVFDNLPTYTNAVGGFNFISYPYEDGYEIHGFPRTDITQYAKVDHVRYVCRGGFFGGKKEKIHELNGLYYTILSETLHNNLMGTEESIFTILAHLYSDDIHRFQVHGDGLIWPFFEKLKNVADMIKEKPKKVKTEKNSKTILYILGFNSPEQFTSVCRSIQEADPYMFEKTRKILINNSTDNSTFDEYDTLCETFGFEEIHQDNLGVCGGRQFVAEHFDETDADFYMFFEDDMHLNSYQNNILFCKNGFRHYVPNLYQTVLSIMVRERLDFLKFSFTEFYGDNSTQWSWYNVPQEIRNLYWPNYNKLPQMGLDANAPKTQFNTISFVNKVSYITGEIYYSNWPQIVSREGNKKMFLDTKWTHPFEQTWMSHIFQLTKKDQIKSAVLLASPITHERFEHYDGSLRKES